MKFVTDTQCLFWYFRNNPRLSPTSKRMFEASEDQRQIIIPIIVLAELLYLSRKYPLPLSFSEAIAYLKEEIRFDIQPLSLDILQKSVSLTQFEIHDALIVATTLHLDLPLMTSDQKIIDSGVVQTLRP